VEGVAAAGGRCPYNRFDRVREIDVMKVSNAHQPGKNIYGVISYAESNVDSPGWVLQYLESGRLYTVDLGIESTEAVMAAIADAADFLDCRPENIQVGDRALVDSSVDETRTETQICLERVRGTTEPRARVYFAQDDVLRPGWYVQFYAEDRLDRLPLWQSDLGDAEAARTEAAWMLGCSPDEIQVGGELLDWPKKRR
jgi:hypothetical protein